MQMGGGGAAGKSGRSCADVSCILHQNIYYYCRNYEECYICWCITAI